MINESVPNIIIRDFRFTAPEHIDNYHHSETNMLHQSLVAQSRHIVSERVRRKFVFKSHKLLNFSIWISLSM